MASLKVKVGNTYQLLNKKDAKLDQTGKHAKIHDWTVFVEVLKGYDPKLVHKVVFDFGAKFSPRVFEHTMAPFQSRQQSYGLSTVEISIITADHQLHKVIYTISNKMIDNSPPSIIKEIPFTGQHLQLLKMKLPDVNFGVELELTAPKAMSREKIAEHICQGTNEIIQVKDKEYTNGKKNRQAWKLKNDASVKCVPSEPECNTFELVSPILRGEKDLERLRKILDVLNHKCNVDTNKSAGFHVHVEVGSDVGVVRRMCQNFVKYERAIDSFMPPSRHNNRYCQPVRKSHIGNKKNNDNIASCTTIQGLAEVVNPGDRYHKINLQNLVSQRQPTVEFRQHSSTSNADKVEAWIRFVLAFRWNSGRFINSPKSLNEDTEVDREFDLLFQWVIKDRYLMDFYSVRRDELSKSRSIPSRGQPDGAASEEMGNGENCCGNCSEMAGPCRSMGE